MRILPGMEIPTSNPNPIDPYYRDEYPNEKDWAAAISRWLKQMGGWLSFHAYRSTFSTGGYPDIRAVHAVAGRGFYAELKTEKGTVKEDQKDWMLAEAAAGSEVYLWRPSDTDEVLDLLQDVNDEAFRRQQR